MEHELLDRLFRADLAELERKYYEKRKPLFEKRALIVKGEYEPKDNEVLRDPEDEQGETTASKGLWRVICR